MAQFFADGLIASSIYILAGLSFLLIFLVCRRFDFSLAALVPAGAYLVLATRPLLTFPLAICIGLAVTGAVAYLTQRFIYQSISNRPGGELACLLASLGLYTFFQNVLSAIFGDNRLSIRTWSVREGFLILNARVTSAQIVIIASALLLVFLLWLFIRLTQSGKMMRAVSNDSFLARSVGINIGNVRLLTAAFAGVIAGAAGILVAFDVDMTPTMGMQPLMMGVAAVIIGKGTFWGTSLAAVLLGVTQHISVIWLPARWQDAVAFLVLLVFMLVRIRFQRMT